MIKRLVTFREGLPVEQFIDVVLINMTRELSEGYASNVREIKEEQEVDLALWRDASLWLSDAVYINDATNEAGEIYYIATSKSKQTIELETVHDLNNRNFKTFDEYVEKRHNCFYTVDFNRNGWKDSKCDCYSFWKNYTCKHIVGIALRNKCCKLPRKALTVKLQKKNSRGRKPKSASALKRD